MDSQFNRFPYSENGVNFDNGYLLSDPNEYQNVEIPPNGLEFNEQSLGLGFNSMDSPFVPSLGFSSTSNSASIWTVDGEGDSSSPSDDNDFADSILKYMSQVLMEEEMEERPCMFHDALALQAAEKSLYEVIGEKYPSTEQTETQIPLSAYQSLESPDNLGSLSDHNSSGRSSYSAGSSFDPPWNGDFTESVGRPSFWETPVPPNFVFQSTSNSSSLRSGSNLFGNGNGVLGSSVGELVIPNYFSQSDLALQFNKGVEEASKFLPKGNQLNIVVENIRPGPEWEARTSGTVVKVEEEDESEYSPRWTGKKNHEREDEDLEEVRNNKQSAVAVDDNEFLELFDRLLICNGRKGHQSSQDGRSQTSPQKEHTNGTKSNGGKARRKKPKGDKETVDLGTLLILSAQAVSSNDLRTANEHLKQVRQHASKFGNGSQRLANLFADALEARIAGNGTQMYSALSSKTQSAADIVKAYQLYITACPFLKNATIFANHSILEHVKEKKATTLHIIDFGIFYGFQWPALIMRLAKIPGGPRKLRITGIDFPQRGFRPDEAVNGTGRRLARYCERFNVPFEYNGIAKKWETIQIKDLKLRPDEVVVVNCLFRLKNLLDETVVVNNPRDTVLNLIRRINPDMFLHSIVNGSYSAPFFVTRFKEVLFHYSALFDMFDANIPRGDEMRLMFENEVFGREVMNVVACEGTERIERPETYKLWQARNMGAGFRQRQLDPELMKKLKLRLKENFQDDDFMVERDGQWLLQGWKGRILFASSVWLPA